MKDIDGVAIFAVGTWNYMKFTEDDLSMIADNTNKLLADGQHKPPLKFGHSDEQIIEGQYDGDPALGWVENLRVEQRSREAEDGTTTSELQLIADFKDVPDIVVLAIEHNLYRSVSVEMDYIRYYGWFLTGVALLGADLPAVKTLDDLSAYLADTNINGIPEMTSRMTLNFSAPNIIKKGNMEKGTPTPPVDGTTPVTPEVNVNHNFSGTTPAPMSEAEQEELRQLRAEKAEQAEKVRLLESENSQFKQQTREVQFSEKRKTFLETYEGHVKEGKLQPAMFEKIKASLEAQKQKFMEQDGYEFNLAPELFHELANAYSSPLPKGEGAAQTKTVDPDIAPDEAYVQKIYETIANAGGKMSYDDATGLVNQAHPALLKAYNEYRTAVSEGRI